MEGKETRDGFIVGEVSVGKHIDIRTTVLYTIASSDEEGQSIKNYKRAI